MLVDIGRSDAFFHYRGKTIKIEDEGVTLILHIGEDGMPEDDEMVDWEDCSTNQVYWAYNDYYLSTVVDISVLEPASERALKRRRLHLRF